MQKRMCRPSEKAHLLRCLPELQLLVPGFSLSVVWEFLQSPFYTDTFEVLWTTLVFNRLHCSGGDAIILLAAFWLVALGWGRYWIYATTWAPVAVFLAICMAYTVLSEYTNVHLVQRWAYSSWMPIIAGIGLVPMLQWIVVPTLSVQMVRGRARLPRHTRRMDVAGRYDPQPTQGDPT